MPSKATAAEVHYGAVYISSPSYPDDTRDKWSVWDPRPVRQGARLIASGLTFAKAEAMAMKLGEVDDV